MEGGEEIRQLLQEIRDAQREHLAEYRRVAELRVRRTKWSSQRVLM
jgi:hypothetical protein